MGLINSSVYVQEGYVDETMSVLDFKSLKSLNVSRRFNGLTCTVKEYDVQDDKYAIDFWLPAGISNFDWRVKNMPTFPNLETLQAFSDTCFVENSTKTRIESLIPVGFEACVSNESNGVTTRYYAESISGSVVNWVPRKYSNDIMADVETVVEMLMDKKYGNVVYTTSEIYSYIGEDGNLVWTSKIESIPEGVEYDTYNDGLYAITEKNDGTTVFEKVVTSVEGNPNLITGDDIEN